MSQKPVNGLCHYLALGAEVTLCDGSTCGSSGKKSSSTFSTSTQVEVFPNPSNGVFTIRTMDGVNAIEVISLQGKVLQKVEVKGNASEFSLDLSSLSTGNYFLKVYAETEVSHQLIQIQD